MCPDEYFNHPQENTYGSGVSNRDWSYDGNSEDDSGEKDNKSHSDSSNSQSTKTSNSSSATSSSSSSASSSASSASSTAASSTATSTATTAVGGAVTGGAVTAIVVAVVVVVAPALSNKPALSDINVDMTGTVLSYSFNAQYSASNVLHLSLLNLDSSFHQDYDLAVPSSASSSEASVKPVYRVAASSSENSSVTSAESSSSAAPVYSKLIQGYFDQLAEGAAYTFKITTDTSVGETTLYSTSISAASAEETKKATPVFFDTTVTPLDTSASFSCDVGYFQECSLVVSLSNGDTTAASQTTPLPRDSAHLIPGVSGSAAYDATITGTFSNLTPGTPYIAHISVRSPTFPETKHDPIPASTLAFHDAKIENSSLTATDTTLTYAYSFSYVEATTLDVLYGSIKKTYTLALDATKKTSAVDVSNRPIYQDSISGSFSGLTPNTPQNFVIHAKSDHTDKDILSKSVSTLAFYAPSFSVVTSKPLDTSFVYSYAFKYVEETALTIDLNGTKQTYTLTLDSTHATTEKDPSGKTIYAYTASSSFTGLSPATSYPLKITASSALFPEASLHDETIKTNAFTKPDLAIASVTPSDSNILCGFTMTYVETTTVVVSDGTDSETMEFAYDGSATGSTDQNERVLNTIQFQKDFTGLTKKQTYPITLTVSSTHVPSFLLYSSSALATGELTTPAIVSSTSTPSPTSVAFTYHLRYIRETTAIVSLDTTRQSFVIPLDDANKRIGSLDEYGNTYYESDISGTFEGLPSGTTYILKIDMSDATYPLNTVATTSIETTEIPTVVSPVLTCPSNDLSYQFTIRYIEEVDLTAKASGGKDERETGFTCGLDEQYKTSDTDSHGNSIYQQTIKGTWRYLYTSTAYAVQLTASSTHYSHAIIYSGNITTGTDTAPSISGTASVDYATSTASLTLTFSDPNNHIQTASGFYVVLVGKTTKTTAGTDETISNGTLTKKITLTAPYTDAQSLDLSEFTKGYSIRCSIYGTSDQGTAGSPNRISTDPVILGELALYY